MLVALLVAALGVGGWLLGTRAFPPRADGPTSAEPTQALEEPAPRAPAAPSARTPSSGTAPAAAPLAPDAPSAASTSGTIRGRIYPPKGASVPDAWTAVVERSELYDAGPVPTRRLEVRGGSPDFAFRDLPLGGYRVRAETPEWNSTPADVALVPGSTTQIVSLPLSPAGFVDGSVLDAKGRPAAQLELTLERRADGLRTSTTTAPDGTFVFRQVHDGEQRLFVGPPDAPFLPPLELSFVAPSLRVPPLELPPTASLLAWTLDSMGDALPAVVLEGFGNPAGRLRATSDARGRIELPWLQPGRWRLSALAEDGRSGRVDLELEPGRAAEIEIRLLSR